MGQSEIKDVNYFKIFPSRQQFLISSFLVNIDGFLKSPSLLNTSCCLTLCSRYVPERLYKIGVLYYILHFKNPIFKVFSVL